MNTTHRRTLFVFSLLAGVIAVSGCGEGAEPQSRIDRTSRDWKMRYERLVRQNEQKAERIEKMEQERADLEKELAALQKKLEEKPTGEERVSAMQAQLTAREEKIGKLQGTIQDLEEQAEKLRQRIHAQAQEGPKQPQGEEAQPVSQSLKSARERAEAAGDALKRAGSELLDAGRHAAARNALQRAAELDPADPVTLYRLAYCHGVLEDAGKAAEFYGRAIQAAEEGSVRTAGLLPRLYSNYGATLVQLERFNEALNAYHEAVQADPNYAPVHFNLGRLYARHLNRPRKAIEAYRRHVALGGDRGTSARDAIARLMDAEEAEESGTEQGK